MRGEGDGLAGRVRGLTGKALQRVTVAAITDCNKPAGFQVDVLSTH